MFKNPSILVEGFFCSPLLLVIILYSRFITQKVLDKTKVLSSKSLYFVI